MGDIEPLTNTDESAGQQLARQALHGWLGGPPPDAQICVAKMTWGIVAVHDHLSEPSWLLLAWDDSASRQARDRVARHIVPSLMLAWLKAAAMRRLYWSAVQPELCKLADTLETTAADSSKKPGLEALEDWLVRAQESLHHLDDKILHAEQAALALLTNLRNIDHALEDKAFQPQAVDLTLSLRDNWLLLKEQMDDDLAYFRRCQLRNARRLEFVESQAQLESNRLARLLTCLFGSLGAVGVLGLLKLTWLDSFANALHIETDIVRVFIALLCAWLGFGTVSRISRVYRGPSRSSTVMPRG